MKLKSYVKVPLLILIINAGFMSGIGVTFMKLVGMLFMSGEVKEHVYMLMVLLVVMGLSTASQIHSLNLAMKNFDQLEVMPIFMVTIMMLWMMSGMIVL